MQTIALVDYGSGNLRSAAKALERAAGDVGLAVDVQVTDKAEAITAADRIVLPGVGAFADCWRGLNGVEGMVEALTRAVIKDAKPFLGICVGMQLMTTRSLEFGVTPGLGWIAGETAAIEPGDPALKIPHMGWNELHLKAAGHPVLAGLAEGDHAYFVHSYAVRLENTGEVLAEVDYGGPIAAVIGRDNMVGTQFHPEKSQAAGLRLLANFLAWRP